MIRAYAVSMATKAERYRYEQERSGPDKPPRAGRRAAARPSGVKNWQKRAGRKRSDYGLEWVGPKGKPSRKSTRASARGMKPGHQQRSSARNRIMRDVTRLRAR